MHDIIIKNGQIIDGTGKSAFSADVAVDNGLIAEIGNLGNVAAKEIIDAMGHYVVPGFIDITNHSDVTAAIFQSPMLENMVRQGVTSIIGGSCGISLAPLTDPDVIHSIRKWARTSSINVNWATMKEFLGEVAKLKLSVNFGTLAGHGTIRRGVAHEEERPLSLEEIASIKMLLQSALREGAFGLSSNMSASHEAAATPDEMTEIVKVMQAEGGIYKTHLRNEGASLIPSVNEVLQVAHSTKVPVSISHLKAVGKKSWPLMKRALAMINRAQASGEKVVYDINPYSSTGSQLSVLLPPWVREGGFSTMLARLRDKSQRQVILGDLSALTLHFDRIRVSEAEDGISPGKTIADLAARSGLTPEDTMIELLLANGGRVSIIGKTLRRKNIALGVGGDECIIASNGTGASQDPSQYVLPHPRSFGTFPRFLSRYVVLDKLISWEKAIYKITSLPAEFMGIRNRGKILPKYAADITVFSPDTIKDRATYENPYLFPTGIPHVIVNGVAVLLNGSLTGARPGSVLRKT